MADFEDRIFRQNVPGRWSQMDSFDANEKSNSSCTEECGECEDEQTTTSLDESALIEEARKLSQADVPEAIRQQILGERLNRPRTGVKGVLADYKAHQKMEKYRREAEIQYRKDVLTRIAEGYRIPVDESPSEEEASNISNHKNERDIDECEEDEDNVDWEALEDGDDLDDAFMREYRHKRLNELKQVQSLPSFRGVKDVDTSNFLEEVENEDDRIFVLVHLYEPSISACSRCNNYLEELSVSHPHWKILRMKASSNSLSFDRVAYPMVTIYRGGESVYVLAGLMHELGEFFTKEDLEWLLETTISKHLEDGAQ